MMGLIISGIERVRAFELAGGIWADGDSVDVGCKNIMTYTMCGGKEVSWVTDGIFN